MENAASLTCWAVALGAVALVFGSRPATKYAAAACITAGVFAAVALALGGAR